MKLFDLFEKKKRKCDHTQNYSCHKYIGHDGTPKINISCYDCDYTNNGHVYADSENWEETFIVTNGVEEKLMNDPEQPERFGKTWESLALSEKHWREELNKMSKVIDEIPPLTEYKVLLPLIDAFDKIYYFQSQLATVALNMHNLYQEIYAWYNEKTNNEDIS